MKAKFWATRIGSVAVVLCIGLPVQGATVVWDGGPVGTGTDLGTAANWVGDVLPNPATPDTAEWNGTAAGPLALVYSTTNLGGAAGNTGISLNVTGAQTSSLSIDSGVNTSALRLNNITIAAGAGPFTLGNGSDVFNITFGGAAGTRTFTNDSSNTARIESDVATAGGGSGNQTFAFTGSGNWLVNGNLETSNSGTSIVTKDGSGTLTLAGANTYIGVSAGANTTVSAGILNLTGTITSTGNSGIASGGTGGNVPILNINSSGTTALSGGNNASILVSNLAANQSGVVNHSSGTVTLTGSVFLGSGVASTTTYGFYNMTGGDITLTGTNRFRIGQSQGAGTANLWYQSGGTVNTSVGIALNDTLGASPGAAGAAVLYATGGSITTGTVNTIGLGIGGRGGQSQATIAGSATVTIGTRTELGGSVAGTPVAADAGRVAVLNLGTGSAGGTLQTTQVVQNATAGALPNGYLNFNGGTLRAQTANANFMSGITQATVFGGGGTIDNNGVNITIGQNLVGPSGSGVTSIGVSGATGYKGAPYVQITGGGTPSVPATAVANIDGSGNVTSITITNPGSGYTSSPTVALVGGGGSAGTLTPAIGAVSGGGMTFTGTGTTTLSGTNTYSGTTNVDGFGKLVVTGSVSGPVSVTAGALDGTGSVGATTITNGSNTLANGNGATGTLTLSSLTFGGTANVDARVGGTVPFSVTGALATTPANGQVTINGQGTWANGFNPIISYGSFGGAASNFALGTITGLNSRQIASGITLSGGAVGISVSGDNPKWTGLQSGEWSTNTIAGSKNWRLVTGGSATDYIDGDAVLFDDSATGTGNVDISVGQVSPTSTTFNNGTKAYTISSSAFTGIGGTGTLTKNGSGSVTISSNNSYTGLTTMNAGTLTLSGANSTIGGTLFNGGTLNLNSANALGTGALTIAAGSAKVLNNTSGGAIIMTDNIAQSWNDDFTFTGSSDLDMGTGAVTVGGGGSNRTVTVGGTLTVGELRAAAHGLVKQGAGTLALTSTGASGGTGVDGSSVNGTLNVAAGTVQMNRAGATGANSGDLTATGLTGTGSIVNGGDDERWLFINAAGNSTFDGLLANGGVGNLGLNKLGAGTLTLSGANTYGGVTTVDNGTLNFSGSGSIANSSEYRIGNGAGVLQVDSASRIGGNLINITSTGAGAGPGAGSSGRLELSGNTTLGNAITLAQRNDTNGSDAIRNVSGNNTLNGLITIVAGGNQARVRSDAGQLTLAGGVTTTSTSGRDLYLQGAGNGNVTGVISNNSGDANGLIRVHKEGSGTWALSNANTYTGATTIDGGTLLVNNTTGSGTGTGPVTVNTGGTLGGTGTINTSSTNSNVVVNAGGSLSPGASAGTLTFNLGTGALNLSAVDNGGFKFEINTPSTSDKVVVSNASTTLNLGTLDFSDFTFTNLGGVTANTDYVLFDALAPYAATLGTASGTFGGFNASLFLDTTNFDVLLKVGAAAANLGDFNSDGKVDAADYVVWRETIGTQAKYDEWRANFGNMYAGSGTGSAGTNGGAVPEPATCVSFVMLSAVTVMGRRRRRG